MITIPKPFGAATSELASFIRSISFTPIPGIEVGWTITEVESGVYACTFSADLPNAVPVGSWSVQIVPAFDPNFFWTPHLTPEPGDVVDMHVYRTPALMMGDGQRVLACLPGIDGETGKSSRRIMDLDAPARIMRFGVATTTVYTHVLYRSTDEAVLPTGAFSYTVLLMPLTGDEAKNPFRAVLSYFWRRYGSKQMHLLAPYASLEKYIARTYAWAFDKWRDPVLQQFELDGVPVGAPQFIVTVHQSRRYGKPHSIREPLSIWNQAWFCSLRSAMGTFRYASKTGDGALLEKARMTKELALHFPQKDGLFCSVIAVPDQMMQIDGVEVRKPLDWSHHYFGNSNRNPVSTDIASSPYHILDMSWTALYMLRWHRELEPDNRLVDYAKRYAEALLALQDEAGYFPAWLDKDTWAVLPALRQSPESAASATFLLLLWEETSDPRYRESALKALEVLVKEVLPEGRWEDFETYWSCCRYGAETLLGKRVKRNGLYKQNSLSMFYLAEALLRCYQVTGEEAHLSHGVRCLDEMLMLQSSFQPEGMPVMTVGGFGVMNCDGELNDARQSLFAPLIIAYGRETGRQEYIERGYAALRASFSMMYCPENPEVVAQWEKRWPFLGEDDYGFMMENYAHGGYANAEDLGIGEFTIFDWGNGAAAEACLYVAERYGNLLGQSAQ